MMKSGEQHRIWQRIVATLLLCSLALGLTYFSWRGLTKVLKVRKNPEVKEGVLYNGKESESGPISAFAAQIGLNDGLVQPDLNVADLVKGEEGSSSNSSLQCGRNIMKFKVIGEGVAELLLDMGDSEPVPLSQVPDACGILVNQTMLEVVLLVPYNGCAIIQENGMYILKMRWRDSVFNITCTMFPKAELKTSVPGLIKAQLPPTSLSLYRMKRYSGWRPLFVPCSPSQRYRFCLYSTPPPTTTVSTTTTTTTAAPKIPIYQNPYFWKRIYPLYSHYVKGNAPRLQNYYQAYKYPGWHLHQQENLKPELFNHAFYNFLLEYLAHAPPTPPPTIASTPCPYTRLSPFARLLAESAFGNHETSVHQNLPQQIRSGYRRPVNPDSFWESFPLLYYASNHDSNSD